MPAVEGDITMHDMMPGCPPDFLSETNQDNLGTWYNSGGRSCER